ncbi:MAG: tetratricopeptide repeat-containing sensor histidine kinase [Pedobacter sp.]|nr:MAG: tetratricopeptide repeat-containing sensor histidine kinase [Pedobacter sp.]
MKTFQQIVFILILLLGVCACTSKSENNSAKGRISKLLDYSQNTGNGPGIQQKYVDSAYTELSGNKNDSVTRFFYRRATSAYYNLGLFDKSLRSAQKIYRLAREAEDTVTMARALYYSGDSFYGKANNDSAFYYYTQSEKLYRKLDDLGTLGEVVLYKAYVYYNAGEYELCESEAIKALRLLLNENKTTHIYTCYNLIATALDGQDNNEEALKYYTLAFDQLNQFKNEGYTAADIENFKSSCYNNMGGVYEKMGNYKKAISIYNSGLKYSNLKKDSPALYAKLLNNLAHAKFKSGDYSNLPGMFYSSLKIREELDNRSGIVASSINLGEYHAFRKDTAQAISYLKYAYLEAREIKSHFDMLNSLKLLSDIDSKNRYFYSNRYITVNDSLQEIAKNTRDKFARIEYETDRLQGEKAELLRKNSFIIGASGVVLLFIGAIFIIYYLNSRNKKLMLIQEQQKANEEIYQLMFEQQNKIDGARTEEKNRIAMELHDGILNNIYAVRLNLEFINKKADDESIAKRKEFIKELQNVEAEIRGVSHDLSRNAIFKEDKTFPSMLEYMIASQKNQFDTLFIADIDEAIEWEGISNIFKVNIYRIIQEALQNINKYSKAENATVTVRHEETVLTVTITDDGIGFDTDTAKGGIGIKNLKKRAALINGVLKITSEPGQGTVIELTFSA